MGEEDTEQAWGLKSLAGDPALPWTYPRTPALKLLDPTHPPADPNPDLRPLTRLPQTCGPCHRP